MRRAIENVEVACDIAAGIDEIMIRQPLGVCAIIAPCNVRHDPVLVGTTE